MIWPGDIIEAKLIKRYKRFLADLRLSNGDVITAHCANTGSMKTCLGDDALCWLTYSDDPKRKLKYSWQAICLEDGWVGINTSLANRLVKEAITSGTVPELTGYSQIKGEQKYGENSRIDWLLKEPGKKDCYVEVKNVTLLLGDGIVGFPDAVTARGTKHLTEMIHLVEQGYRAVLFYCVQRTSAQSVVPARAFDPEYANTLCRAVKAGVEVLAYRARITQEEVVLADPLPINLN